MTGIFSALGVGELANNAMDLADRLHTSGAEKGELANEARRIANQARRIDADIRVAELKVQEKEASHGSIFVAGARPAQLWVGVLVTVMAAVVVPLLNGIGGNLMADWAPVEIPWEVLASTAGLSGNAAWLRSSEKKKGVARTRINSGGENR